MSIQILPPDVASQIAAGEVVERPASVVKELIENALDAAATQIVVQCLAAGKRLVEVSDNGVGISKEDLPLATCRHATSKIRTAQDLWQIQTLGFRGEALASIGSVSRLTITSRPASQDVAYRLWMDGGSQPQIVAVAAPPGTTVRVEDLFFNVPARRKFLKSEITERQRIEAVVFDYALAFPRVQFQLSQEGRISFTSSGNGERREILGQLIGAEEAALLIEVVYEETRMRIEGFVSPPTVTRSSRREIHLFVNRRPIQDPLLTSAIMQAYHTLLMVGRYPIVWLFLEIEPSQVDVNVHPTKAEVRFADPQLVYRCVQHAVRRALVTTASVASVPHFPVWQPPSEAVQPETPKGEQSVFLLSSTQPRLSIESPSLKQNVPLLRWIGQVANAYIVAEGPDGLYLIDQHAAHERVLYEKFLRQPQTPVPSQELLHPSLLTLSPAQAQMLEELLPPLSRLGFEVVPFGLNVYQVRAIPALFAGVDGAYALRAVVEDFEENEEPLSQELEKRLIARICKRAAVKAGQSLSPEEQKALLRDLEACQSPRTCPHGRPTMVHLSVELLERQFGRRGST
ncbi:MAG: DNA mismatch repair endonuclease MutL [Anaerolineales bacterium]|nr:DNA mismatch repair endonuclease MutL [Anaerolineales bacterium]MDW8161805.1 DNA mismatch repair endonuclease MutL [Anaerolineales bacterium]